jgi:glycosyltransferase involved in cell wall biosynthesis
MESVQRQTYQNFEMVICDDGSSDKSCEVVERYAQQDPRVILVRQPNRGEPAASTTAFAHSKGDILCILDADDYCHPRRLEQVVRMFQERPYVGFVNHPFIAVDRDGRELHPVYMLDQLEEGWLAETVLRRGGRWPYMNACSNAIRCPTESGPIFCSTCFCHW